MYSRCTADLSQTLNAALGRSLSWLRTVKGHFARQKDKKSPSIPEHDKVTKVGHCGAGTNRSKIDLTRHLGAAIYQSSSLSHEDLLKVHPGLKNHPKSLSCYKPYFWEGQTDVKESPTHTSQCVKTKYHI